MDESRLWLAIVAGFGVVLVAAAFVAGGRLRRDLPGDGPRAKPGQRLLGWGLLLGGAALAAYPLLTSLGPGPAPEPPTARYGWLRTGSVKPNQVCEGPFTIVLPAIGVAEPVHEGANDENLRLGPCHYEGTARPGELSNCCIAGHRSTYTAPFKRLLEMVPGSEIVVLGSGFERRYRVAWVREVDAKDGSYLAPTNVEALTLSTCHPYGLASKRLMLRAYPGEAGWSAARARPVDERWVGPKLVLLQPDGLAGLEAAWSDAMPPPHPGRSSDRRIPLEVAKPEGQATLEPAAAWPETPLLPPARPQEEAP